MNPIKAQLDFDPLAVKKLVKEWPKRFDALKRVTILKVVREALEGVQENEPSMDKELRGYTDKLEIYRVRGIVSYAIMHNGDVPTKQFGELDAETTALYIHPTTKGRGKTPLASSILAQFAPFTLKSWPQSLPKDQSIVVYRSVRPDEVRRIYLRNIKDTNAMSKALIRSGIPFKKEEYATEDMEAVSDLVFQVIRTEFGIGKRRMAHWRPSLKRSKSAQIMESLTRDIKLMRTMGDVKYIGWRRLGMIKNVVPPRDIEEVAEFQKRIIGDL